MITAVVPLSLSLPGHDGGRWAVRASLAAGRAIAHVAAVAMHHVRRPAPAPLRHAEALFNQPSRPMPGRG